MFRTLPFYAAGAISVLLVLVTVKNHPFIAVLASISFVLNLVIALNFRCPRCRLPIDSREHSGYEFGYLPSQICPRCGRSRRGVWPFQYLFAPE